MTNKFADLEALAEKFFLSASTSFVKEASATTLKLKDCHDFSYSSILRELRKNNSEQVKEFQLLFKKYFDENVANSEEKSDKLALINTLSDLSNKYEIEIDEDFIKNASAIELGNPEYAGRYLSDIVKFVMQRISPENRERSLYRLKNKILSLNEIEIANKNIPPSSAMGQSITFIKHVLLNHNPSYIRDVLNNIAKHLV